MRSKHNAAPFVLCVGMSAAGNLLCEDQFRCSICLDVFTDPVTTPCGHNFCKNCIFEHWDINNRSKCPLCNEIFNKRPQLRINTFISEMVAQFRQEASLKANSKSSQQQAAKPGEVPCDLCSGTTLKALKSCLVCLVSYCETHLEPHLKVPALKRHQMTEPVENLEGRICKQHNKLLELFCKSDQTCLCMLCAVLDHKMHDVVPLEEEYEAKKEELNETEDEIQMMIQGKKFELEEICHSLSNSEVTADLEIAEGIHVFRSLMDLVEKGLNELIDNINKKLENESSRAKRFIRDLEQEISDLIERSSEVKKLLLSEDKLHLLQSCSSLKPAPPMKDRTETYILSSYEGTMMRALAQLQEALGEEMMKQFELKRVQQYAVDVTLDPDTANPELVLSDDGKQVSHCDEKKTLPDNPKRFSYYAFVAAKQSFSWGRFYFEVQVKGKTKWSVGVIKESINRKGLVIPRPQNGFWFVSLNENEYKVFASTSVCLSLKSQPEKVGVFVDYEGGLVSFYDPNTACIIYTFSGCSFTEQLYPYFCPGVNDGGKNSAPLIICPVRQTEGFIRNV